jgi:hypothetical protein
MFGFLPVRVECGPAVSAFDDTLKGRVLVVQGGRMLDPYTLGETLRMERQILAERHAREVRWREHPSQSRAATSSGHLRRRLARLLLALADRLDPRAVVSVPHVPARPTLNGTLHHA